VRKKQGSESVSVGPDNPTVEPFQWCWVCGNALWDWSTVYESTTFLGRVAICRHCAKNLHDAVVTTNRAGLLGYHDRATWHRAKNRGK
jgi:hypothetical protein